jgi:xanthine dehydrogenase accessory factor
MRRDVAHLTTELIDDRQPFVVGTVVWRRGPSSGKLGAQILVLPDGTVRGWLGGACAEPTVVREALAALEDGHPRLMLLGPVDEIGGGHRDGVTLVPMACESEGAMEVYLEPMLPQPHVVVVGRSPAVDTLARLAEQLGWRATVVDDGGDARDHPGVTSFVSTLDFNGLGVDGRSFIVVATQGHYDEAALKAALATDAAYVGLVASRKRASSVIEFLRTSGVGDEALTRVTAPAGLDLGSIEHDEMAVAILAELVAVKAQGGLMGGIEIQAPEVAVDPVCHMDVDIQDAKYISQFDDDTYYFCAAGCQRAFDANPHSFLSGAK